VRTRAAGLTIALVLVALVLLALEVVQRSPASPPQPSPRPAAPPPSASATSPGPAVSRDIFRYADSPEPQSHAARASREADERRTEPPPPAGPRLVGVLRRGGGLLAALAVEGEVVLLSPGQSAAGATLLSVDEESVRLRLADGSERTLTVAE
jgi:hypothetical protein